MTEIFTNIRDEIKELAEESWLLANMQTNPFKVAEALNLITECFRSILTEEEIEFLQFYFFMKMEMMKE